MNVELGRWDNRVEAWLVAEAGGYHVHIIPMIYNHRVVLTPIGDYGVYDAGWCYPTGLAAAAAVRAWEYDADPEPGGYIKRVGMTDLWVAGRRDVLTTGR